ncbi:hypothetical protein Tco_0758898 [Tanacetum coccineum]
MSANPISMCAFLALTCTKLESELMRNGYPTGRSPMSGLILSRNKVLGLLQICPVGTSCWCWVGGNKSVIGLTGYEGTLCKSSDSEYCLNGLRA